MLSEIITRFDAMDVEASGDFKLTDDQQYIFNNVMTSWMNRGVQYAVLDAKSGSGKSTLIRAIEKSMIQGGVSIAITASTGKAASALGGKTIHSFLGLSMKQNEKATNSDEALELSVREDAELEKADVIVIDEASMLGQQLFREIDKRNFNYVFFVMDSSQLPPVKQSKVDWDEVADRKYTLTKTLRAKDPRIMKLFEDFKQYRDDDDSELDLFSYVNGDNIVKIDWEDVDYIPANSESCVVGYRNKLVEFIADSVTAKGHHLYNLNAGVTITRMVVKRSNGKPVETKWGYARNFISDQIFYNGEDVKIIKLEEVTKSIQDYGYAYYHDMKLTLSKNGLSVIVMRDGPETEEDKFFIKLPPKVMLDDVMLCEIDDTHIVPMYVGSEERYKAILDELFMVLLPKLSVQRYVKAFLKKGEIDSAAPGDVKMGMKAVLKGIRTKDELIEWFNSSDYTVSRKAAWAEYLSARATVSARYTTSRTVHKAQGLSIPAVVITDLSFFGASKSAQYVAVTRAKHGIVFVENVPDVFHGETYENE